MIDALGIPFDEHRKWLPVRVSDFPTPKKISNARAIVQWRRRWEGRPCWFCGRPTTSAGFDASRGELHHMARYDLPTCFSWLCASCHRHDGRAVTREALGSLIVWKHHFDRSNLSWVVLAIALGRHLPDLKDVTLT